jgi:tetratricopeptide (TPR) repeat protein
VGAPDSGLGSGAAMDQPVPVPGVDPSRVNTPAELAVCLDGLRLRRGLSYEAMTKAVGRLQSPPGGPRWEPLGKSTVGEIVTGKRLPTKGKLLTFMAVCKVATADRAQWLAAWERASTADLSIPAGAVPVREARPRRLGVHAAIQVDGGADELPTYVPRDRDVELRAALAIGAEHGCFMLLVGGSSVGKTRTLYEAVLATLPDWWLVHPDRDDPERLRALAAGPTPRTVVWLDELQRYLGAAEGLAAGTVRALLRAGVVLVGTMWPDAYAIRTALPLPGGEDPHARDRELLHLAQILDVADAFTSAEDAHARQLATRDGRIHAAMDCADGGLTQALAAGPELVRWWEQAPSPYAKAVITAAVDARRLGMESPVTPEFLADAVPGYLSSAERATAPDGWLRQALAYCTTRLHGAASALTPAGGVTMGRIVGYAAADYLLQHGNRVRRTVYPPASFWDACRTRVTNSRDVLALGEAACNRALLDVAEGLYRSAAGEPEAVLSLCDLLQERGRVDEAEQLLLAALADGNPFSATALARLLTRSGKDAEAEQVLRDGLRAGMPATRRHLAIVLEQQRRFDEAEVILREGLATRDPDSRQRLGFMLMRELRRVAEAEQLLRDGVVGEDHNVVVPLAFLLQDQGRVDEAERILRDGMVMGDPAARFRLSELLQNLGRAEEAEQVSRDGLALDDPMARLALDRLLQEQGRLAEAEQIWREGVSNGERHAPRYLAEFLQEQGRLAEAERVLRDAIAAGLDGSSDDLAELLTATGRADEADRLRCLGLDASGTQRTRAE